MRPHRDEPPSPPIIIRSSTWASRTPTDRANGRDRPAPDGTRRIVVGWLLLHGRRQIEQIYAFARDSFRGCQTEFQVQAFPFRHDLGQHGTLPDDPNFEFWQMLKEGYDHFEITRVPPKGSTCATGVTSSTPTQENGRDFSPTAACPPEMTQPEALQTAYRAPSEAASIRRSRRPVAEATSTQPASPTITGLERSSPGRRTGRAAAPRGESVSRLPPNMSQPGSRQRSPLHPLRLPLLPQPPAHRRLSSSAPETVRQDTTEGRCADPE